MLLLGDMPARPAECLAGWMLGSLMPCLSFGQLSFSAMPHKQPATVMPCLPKTLGIFLSEKPPPPDESSSHMPPFSNKIFTSSVGFSRQLASHHCPQLPVWPRHCHCHFHSAEKSQAFSPPAMPSATPSSPSSQPLPLLRLAHWLCNQDGRAAFSACLAFSCHAIT